MSKPVTKRRGSKWEQCSKMLRGWLCMREVGHKGKHHPFVDGIVEHEIEQIKKEWANKPTRTTKRKGRK